MKKNNILVTGISSAFIQKIISKFNLNEFNIYGVSRKKIDIEKEKLTKLFIGDLEDISFLESLFKSNKFDLIIHGAALTHSYNKTDYMKINFNITKEIVDIIKNDTSIKFIFISTRVSGINSGGYGESKLYAENYIKTNHKNYLIFRPSEIFGSEKNEGIDELFDKLFFNKIILCPINLKYKLFPLHIEDAAALTYTFIQKNLINQEIIINGNNGFTYYGLVSKVKKKFSLKIFIVPIPKIIMFIISFIINNFKLKIGVYPDQVKRLYCKKTYQIHKYCFYDIFRYLEEKYEK